MTQEEKDALLEELKRDDLVAGEIYRYHYKGESEVIIGKCTLNGTANAIAIKESSEDFWLDGRFNMTSHMSETNEEEKQWLEACIKAGKFVSLEDSKKDEVPEYVECEHWAGHSYTKGEIYPVVNERVMNLKEAGSNIMRVARFDETQHFKPSTKEAYDAQQIKTVEPVRLERKTATELGFKVGDKFTVVGDEYKTFKIGDVVTLVDDDKTYSPHFKDQNGYSAYCYWLDLTPYIESDVPVIEDMNAILEEAKRRFPVGCTFYPISSSGEVIGTARIQSKECHLYDSKKDKSPWIIGSWNVRNPSGQWAQIISMPEEDLTGRYLECMVDKPQSTRFEKGDYVCIERKISDKCYMIENSWTYSLNSVNVSHFKLMPVGWTPDYDDLPEIIADAQPAKIQEPIEYLFRPSRII